MPPTVSDYRS